MHVYSLFVRLLRLQPRPRAQVPALARALRRLDAKLTPLLNRRRLRGIGIEVESAQDEQGVGEERR